LSGEKHFTAEEAKEIGEKLGISTVDSNTNVSDDDPLTTGKIALAHLNEFPDYYTRLDKMEEEAEAHWEKQGE